MLSKILLYVHTIKYLKPKQIAFRFYYSLMKNVIERFRTNELLELPKFKNGKGLILKNPITTNTSYIDNHSFVFLNLPHIFNHKIDWNFSSNGKLWVYNLNYFDFLLQSDISKENGLKLMLDFAGHYETHLDGLEPYPTSVRIINWVKYISLHNIESNEIDKVIYTDLQRLQRNIEYHLMGNHLLENGFALLFGAYYFQDSKLLDKCNGILIPELKEQVLSDGAHFELSPMYHQIVLSRVLDCINLIGNNEEFVSDELHVLLEKKGAEMLGWLKNITFSNGDIPHVNDSTWNIAPNTESLIEYAQSLSVEPIDIELAESGYRKFEEHNYELLVDVGDIGPDYIPGHAHSDTLNFIIYHNKQPLIVDTGISTYDKNTIRQHQRSTSAHNTVTVIGKEQSQVWGGFRVSRRAKGKVIKENPRLTVASHNGYDTMGIIHKRSYTYTANKIGIIDELNKVTSASAFLHFHPSMKVIVKDNCISGTFGKIHIEGSSELNSNKYQYALGFNKTEEATMITIKFEQKLRTNFELF